MLDQAEPYAPLLVHGGALWTGRSRPEGALSYRLELYSPDGARKLAETALPHSIGSIHPYGPGRALVLGKSFRTEWLTPYSVVTYQRGALRASTYSFSRRWQVEDFAGTPSAQYYTEPGGSSVLAMGTFGPGALSPSISAPGAMALVGRSLFVLERNGFALGDENLVKIDLRTRAASRTFPAKRQGLVSLLALEGGGHVAVAETLADRVLLVDIGTNRLAATIPVPAGRPPLRALKA